MFWIVLNNYFDKNKKRLLNLDLHESISLAYNRLVLRVSSKHKDSVLDALLLLIGIQVFMLFSNTFKADMKLFTSRFLYECIHFTM
jgi:hypothetical protein